MVRGSIVCIGRGIVGRGELGHRVAHRQLRRRSAARAASASATMPYAVPVKVAAKTNIILRLVEADADGVDEEAHATKLQLTKAKLGTKLLDVMERFARHHNRRCAEGERVEASRLDASDREGPLDVQVPVGNLLNPLDSSEQTLDITLRRAQTDEEIAREAPAVAAAAAETREAAAPAAAAAGKGDDNLPATAQDPSEFQPSPTFEGYRPGMVFKRGFFGQGYYKDKLLTDIETKKAEQAEDAALYDAAATYDGPREGFVFTTRELGTGYYKDRPPPMFDPNAVDLVARGAIVLRGYDLPPPNGMLFSKHEFDQIRIGASPDTVLVIFFEKCAEDGGGSAKIAPQYKKMANQFWPKAVLMRADVDEAKDLALACSVTSAPTFIFFKNAKPVDKCKGTCEMTINVKIVKALKLGVVKRKHQWGDGLLKGK